MERRVEHGGELWRGRRKSRRPLATRRAVHVVFRSSLAKGAWSFLAARHAVYVREQLPKVARLYGVRLYEISNNGNHIHLLLRARTQEGLKSFFMVFCGKLASRITGARRGKPFGRRFFDHVPYTRIVEWGNAFKVAKNYVLKNALEALGLVTHHRARNPRAPD